MDWEAKQVTCPRGKRSQLWLPQKDNWGNDVIHVKFSNDPEVAFDCLPGTARPARISAALSNSFGFGGQNVCLIFARDGS